MVDDIKINSKDIQLFPLQKLQYDSKKINPILMSFFLMSLLRCLEQIRNTLENYFVMS